MPGHYDKVGKGYSGLGKQELNRRMKQHTALRDKALRKGDAADKTVKDMVKLIGQFGSDKGFPTDAAYRTMDKAYMTRQKQYKKAVNFNKGLKKLGLNK
jgi:hypothetical protein